MEHGLYGGDQDGSATRADLLFSYGYRLYRPDRNGALVSLTGVSYGPDVFAAPDPEWRAPLSESTALRDTE
jgi:hypothetical protein